jgi:hypothetical protein
MNDVIPFGKPLCVECGHEFGKPRMDCGCRVCSLRRRAVRLMGTHDADGVGMRLFQTVWHLLEESGLVDKAQGAEYRRVRDAFDAVGLYGVIEFFIMQHANQVPKNAKPEEVVLPLPELELPEPPDYWNREDHKP